MSLSTQLLSGCLRGEVEKRWQYYVHHGTMSPLSDMDIVLPEHPHLSPKMTA